jgi:hypothetical protein
MVAEDTTGPMGVITIEQADFEPASDASLGCNSHDDATLAQTLNRLAARDVTSPGPTTSLGRARLRRGQFTGRLTPFWATPARVSANLGGLAAELDQAVAQVLRRLAASR